MAKTTLKQKSSAFFEKAKNTVGDIYTDVASHWKKPAKGNFMSYKEIAAYSVGGMGVSMVSFFIGHLGFGASSMLLAATIGLRPLHIQTMATLQTILNLFFYVIRGKLVDNTRTKWGRFRPYIAIMGLPLVVLSVIYLFLPFSTMSYTLKLIMTFLFGISVSMLSPLLTDTFGELGSCMSPNTAERTKMFTIYSLVFSFAPTVYNFLVPILSNFTGGYTNINTYRYVIAPVGILGLGLVLFTAFGCKERVVTSNSYVQKVGIIEGCIAVWKNKYWWIRLVSGFVAFLEGANLVLFSWIYIYSTQDMTTYAILTTIMGTASGIAMFVSPFLLSKLGNRKLLLFHNAFNILMVTGMLGTFKLPILFFIFMYLNSAVNATSMVYGPVHAAEVKDSIQYQSGFRVDFTLGAAGMIAMPITIVTGYAIPFVYEAMGLTFNFNVLYDPIIRNNLFYVLCILSILGAALNLIPFFFYNLSREKHRAIYAALKYRAVNNDYANGIVNYRDIKETVELYNEMMGYANAPDPDIKQAKADLKAIKSAPLVTEEMKRSIEWKDETARAEIIQRAKAERKKAIKDAKKAIFEARKLKEFKESIDEVFIPEIQKYNEPFMIAKVKIAEDIANVDVNGVTNIKPITIPSTEADEKTSKKIARHVKKTNKALKNMQKAVTKRYPKGIYVDYWQLLQDALNEKPETKEEKKVANRNIKIAKKAYESFRKTYKLYFDSKQLKADSYASTHYDNYIAAMYDEATAEVDRMNDEETKNDRANLAVQKAELQLIKAKKLHERTEKLAENTAKKKNLTYSPTPFDPQLYGIDENGYALKVTGDELQSILDLISASRSLKKAKSNHEKTEKSRKKQAKKDKTPFEYTPFSAELYGLDDLGYTIKNDVNKEEEL